MGPTIPHTFCAASKIPNTCPLFSEETAALVSAVSIVFIMPNASCIPRRREKTKKKEICQKKDRKIYNKLLGKDTYLPLTIQVKIA
jgi:hypothetical protein